MDVQQTHSHPHGSVGGAHLPFADRVRTVGSDDVFSWLSRGWRDFVRSGMASAAYGAIFALAGYVIAVGLARLDSPFLLLPVAAGFTLVAPVLAIGFYRMSKTLEGGGQPTFNEAVTAAQANGFHILTAGLVLMLYGLIWVRVATLIFALMFPATSFSFDAMLAVLPTTAGLLFLIVSVAVGAAFALVAFLFCAVALPMMMDRPGTDFFTAALVSMTAVLRNPGPMLLWAGIIAVVTAAGMAFFFLGLIIAMPLIGHASWHAYRALVKPAE
ncbi:DUF2189 domain-containing protein [Caenispirillum bisanense]|uniref:DUF2189 domain-containing protein n=1 Tax=Caenispirillum bisanense TaxID=414052 RepID=UPI0031CF8FE8